MNRIWSRSSLYQIRVAFIAMIAVLGVTMHGVLAAAAPHQHDDHALAPYRLRCEYWDNPMGLDAPRPRFSWILQANRPAARGLKQSAYRILVAASVTTLRKDKGDLWDSGLVQSEQMNQIRYTGKPLDSSRRYWWKVRSVDQFGKASAWSTPAQWTTGILRDTDWQEAKWIGAPSANMPVEKNGPKAKYETVLLRRELTIKPGLKRAVIHLCGLGQYEMTLNGSKVGDALLAPGWTGYDKTCLYDTYDVTSSLHLGGNAIGLFLGNGFYNVHAGRYTNKQGSYGNLQAIGLIRLEYADGSVQNVVTDEHWKAASGPITFSSIYGGEDYDARLEQTGWNLPGFGDGAWDTPAVTKGPGGALKGLSCAAPPIRSLSVLVPVNQKQTEPNVTVYDLGQNASLMIGFKVKGPVGSSLKITPSELIDEKGNINDTMCRGQSYWTYTLRGTGDESYLSKFYYRGGRYLKVELLAAPDGGLPVLESLEGHVIRADAPSVGKFSCSNDLYNKVYELVRWSQMNNMVSVMTDCPTREKLGYLEEDYLNGPALRYNFDLSTLITKMTNDMFDAQFANGLVPMRVPNYYHWDESQGWNKFMTSPEWGSACIMVPFQQYEFDGDLAMLEQRYEEMKRYLGYLDRRSSSNLLSFGLGDWYDNHSEGEPTLTPVGLTNTAFYYQDYCVLSHIAKILGKTDEAAQFQQRAEQIQTAFNQKYFNAETGDYAAGAQGSNCLPLAMEIVEPAHRQVVFDRLVKDVQTKGVTVGEVSFRYLLRSLADQGRSDLIYSTFATETQGYGLQVKLGKTSLTEGWNGGASQNHFMYGQINEWFFHDLAGIQLDPDGAGFHKIVIKPSLVGDLTEVKASYDSRQGLIVSAWTRLASRLTMNVTIPIGATATVYVPTDNPKTVRESGHPAVAAQGIQYLRMEGGAAVYAVGSGSYQFSSVFDVNPGRHQGHLDLAKE